MLSPSLRCNTSEPISVETCQSYAPLVLPLPKYSKQTQIYVEPLYFTIYNQKVIFISVTLLNDIIFYDIYNCMHVYVLWFCMETMHCLAWAVWHELCSMNYVACTLWHELCSMNRVACTLWHKLCSMNRMAWTVWHELCSVLLWHALCGMYCVACTAHYVLGESSFKTIFF